MGYLLGAIAAIAILFLISRISYKATLDLGVLALAIMMSIYIGALLATEDINLVIMETASATTVLVIAIICRSQWPLGIGVLILAHAAYDHFLGSTTNIADWYIPMCVGFDLAFGTGFIALHIQHNSKQASDDG